MATGIAAQDPPTVSDDEGARGPGFIKALSRFDATALVAGSMIGSAIFIVPADILRQVGAPGLLLLVWAVTALVVVLGALSYGELSAMFPRTGGLYVYLREGLSPLLGFLYGWALFAVILVFASLLTSTLGLLLGTIMDPRKMQMLFAVILLPATMLGCVYYPWSALHHIRWLQILVLINPMVYMSEGLRAVLTPTLGHMPMWGVLLALIGGTAIFGYLGTRTFTKRVLN